MKPKRGYRKGSSFPGKPTNRAKSAPKKKYYATKSKMKAVSSTTMKGNRG